MSSSLEPQYQASFVRFTSAVGCSLAAFERGDLAANHVRDHRFVANVRREAVARRAATRPAPSPATMPPVSGVIRYRNGIQSANGMYSPNITRCILSYVPTILPSRPTSTAEL